MDALLFSRAQKKICRSGLPFRETALTEFGRGFVKVGENRLMTS